MKALVKKSHLKTLSFDRNSLPSKLTHMIAGGQQVEASKEHNTDTLVEPDGSHFTHTDGKNVSVNTCM